MSNKKYKKSTRYFNGYNPNRQVTLSGLSNMNDNMKRAIVRSENEFTVLTALQGVQKNCQNSNIVLDAEVPVMVNVANAMVDFKIVRWKNAQYIDVNPIGRSGEHEDPSQYARDVNVFNYMKEHKHPYVVYIFENGNLFQQMIRPIDIKEHLSLSANAQKPVLVFIEGTTFKAYPVEEYTTIKPVLE